MNTTKETTSRRHLVFIGILIALLLVIAGAIAYLTDTDTITNKLSVDTNLDIELTEPRYNEEKLKDENYGLNLNPAETIIKDPTIENLGSVPAYVAVDIQVPIYSGQVFDRTTGIITQSSNIDLYTWVLKDGWRVINNSEIVNNYRTYTIVNENVFNQNDVKVLFDSVTVSNIVSDYSKENSRIESIDVTDLIINAYAIQSKGFVDVEDAFDAYLAQSGANVREVFAIYSDTDNSLNFYNRTGQPSVGDTYADRKVSSVYEGFDTEIYNNPEDVIWNDNKTNIISSRAIDEGISPVSTKNWFNGASSLQTVNLTNMDTSELTNADNMFKDATQLYSVNLEGWNQDILMKSDTLLTNCESLNLNVVEGVPENVIPVVSKSDYAALENRIKTLENKMTTNETAQSNYWKKVYPVGSLYISYVSTSPAVLFGGSWTQITGRFLRMANDVGTGGADTHTLTEAEMPSHTHAPPVAVNYNGDAGYYRALFTTNSGFWSGADWNNAVSRTGGSKAHNNMPAYQNVYTWRRTA